MSPVVFLDTTVLLQGFTTARGGRDPALALSDNDARRYTFEKCVYEAYMAFRGVGGKKPDEGRGRWAESNLRAPNDPRPIGQLASKYHGGSTRYAHFWVSQIHESYGVDRHLDNDDSEFAVALRSIAEQRDRYESLCDDFRCFLDVHQVRILYYAAVFGSEDIEGRSRASDVSARSMDRLVRETAIPSEDYENVFAALRLRADLFVTDDARLRNAAWSLGLNLALTSSSFCSVAEYADVVADWRTEHQAQHAVAADRGEEGRSG